jgi:hypothetical protein
MKKAILFGSGTTGKKFYERLKHRYDILCATDNDARNYGKELLPGVVIKDKSIISEGGYDCIIISTYAGFEEVQRQLIEEFNIDEAKIVSKFVETVIAAKKQYLQSFSQIVYAKNIPGSVCEVGVYRGGFAKDINRCFPDRTLYLFDTFEGYDERDVNIEKTKVTKALEAGYLSFTAPEIVLSKMLHKEKCVIKKGFFPDTFDLHDKKFCFVNIDVDLYQPTLAALELFYPRMEKGGIIVVHDYFFENINGASDAVDEFAQKYGLAISPIGDTISIAFVIN